MSLRARLLAGMVVLVAAGLTAAAAVTYAEQRSFLLDRVDGQVQAALGPLSFALRAERLPASRPPEAGRRPGFDLPPGTFGEIVGPSGKVLKQRTFSYGQRTGSAPALPAAYPVAAADGRGGRSGQGGRAATFTIRAPGGVQYRAAAIRDGRDVAVAAVPLHDTETTLHRLIVVELLVGGAVILALVALGWVVIRIGLRPLERIGPAASEITHGDLSRRVPDDGPAEVNRLGRSLNEMLGQIETAFADRSRSEARLRRFAADASHELRTPLAAIRGYAELFRIGAASDPETLSRAMARIEAEATRMGVLVEDLLVLAQLDHQPEPRREPVDVGALAREATLDARAAAGGSGPERAITVHADEGPAAALVSGDADRLRQVLANLLRNAVIHTPAGTPIEVEVRRDADRVVLSVRDHGPGLPDGDPAQLFERFWRQQGGRRRGPGGAGLGLAIVRAIAEAHGGTVSAQTAHEGGAIFTVVLPAPAVAEQTGPSSDVSQQTLRLLTPGS